MRARLGWLRLMMAATWAGCLPSVSERGGPAPTAGAGSSPGAGAGAAAGTGAAGVPPGGAAAPAPTPGAPTAPSAAPPAAGSPGAATPATGQRVQGNPFVGAAMYVNADYAAQAGRSASAQDAVVAAGARVAARMPTALWLDRIAALAGGAGNGGRLGLAGHLDAAVTQAKGGEMVVVLVVYDLPNRDCRSLASNGELMEEAGLVRYQKEFIDAIATTLTAKPEYKKLRVVVVLEPDSLPNMVTNAQSVPACRHVAEKDFYGRGITYALGKLGALDHVYIYLDIAHGGWLGWEDKRQQAVALYAKILAGAGEAAKKAVRGLATNIANYTPLTEPKLDPSQESVRASTFYQYNSDIDEARFVASLARAFAAQGLPNLGFLIDTSRNGWADNPDPAAPSDRRLARGNWCNILGSGIGRPPTIAPQGLGPVDALFWVKPPGESDGYGSLQNPENKPDAEGKRFDPDCDSAQAAHRDSAPNAPSAGAWFPAHFEALVKAANPPLGP